MKALVKSKPEPGLWLEDVPKPAVGINDVLIRVHRTGICGTDLHIYKWDDWAARTIPVPMVVGHEFVGEIVATGSNVADFFPGQIVSGEGHVVCGRCRNCLAGRRHLCADTKGIGVNRPGAFAEYLVVPMTNVWLQAPGIDKDVAVDAMLNSVIASPMLKYRAPFVLEQPEEAWFDCNLMQKDLNLALEAGRQLDVPLPTTAIANELMTAARGLGLGKRDFAIVYEVLGRLAGMPQAAA